MDYKPVPGARGPQTVLQADLRLTSRADRLSFHPPWLGWGAASGTGSILPPIQSHRGDERAPDPGGPRFAGWRRYALALAVAAVGVFVTQLFAGEMFTTPLVGMVVLVSLFLGIGPGHVAIAAAWIALLLYEEPRWELAIEDNAVAERWAISLVVALVLVWIGWSLQRRRRTGGRAGERGRARVGDREGPAGAGDVVVSRYDSVRGRACARDSNAGPARCDRAALSD